LARCVYFGNWVGIFDRVLFGVNDTEKKETIESLKKIGTLVLEAQQGYIRNPSSVKFNQKKCAG
jgi:hypothetical protein